MTDTTTVGPPADDAETDALAAILAQVFTIPPDIGGGAKAWMARAGMENVRVVRLGREVAGGCLILPMGQWFGGRPVPMAGIAAVAVAPQHRARGAGTALMRAILAEQRAAGVPISTLYPATQTLYRRVGYERAGVKLRASIPCKAIEVRERALPVRRATDADNAAIEACYARRARGSAGLIDRSAYGWARVRGATGPAVHGYVVEESGEITGYVTYVAVSQPPGQPNLGCTDLVATTPAAAQRLLGFFAEHRSLAGDVSWVCGPVDPLLFHLPEQRDAVVTVQYVWMTRLLDVAAAFAARGWPPGLAAELHLDVTDELLPENAGRWTVRIEGGRAVLARGGNGALRCDIRGLAALWTGYLAPADAVACGALRGPPEQVAAAASALAGPLPWMSDHF